MLVQLTLNMGKLESREGDLGLHHCPRSGEVPKPQPGTSVLTRECHGDSSFPLNLSSGAHSWLMVAPAINSRELEKCALSCLPCPSCTWGRCACRREVIDLEEKSRSLLHISLCRVAALQPSCITSTWMAAEGRSQGLCLGRFRKVWKDRKLFSCCSVSTVTSTLCL